MEQHLRRIREDVIREGYKANNHPKTLVIKSLEEKISVPTLYRILDEKPIEYPVKKKPTQKQCRNVVKLIKKANKL